MYIEVYDRTSISTLLNNISEFSGLMFETDRIGGFTVAEFNLQRNILDEHRDLAIFNPIVISEGDEVAWEGFIAHPMKTSPTNIHVACLGWSSILSKTGTSANQAAKKMSTFMSSTVLGDSTVTAFLSAGTITDSTYTCPAMEDVRPWKYYDELLDEYNKWMDWRWWVGEGRTLNLNAPKTTADWIILAEDAPGFEVSDSPENFWNKVIYSYTIDGSIIKVASTSDATSIADYGRTVCKHLDIPGRVSGAAQALDIATIYLNKGKDMTVMGSIKTPNVYSASSENPALSWKVRGGDVIKLQNFLSPIAAIDSSVDEITSFETKTIRYEHASKSIVVVPKDWDSGLEPLFARLETKASKM